MPITNHTRATDVVAQANEDTQNKKDEPHDGHNAGRTPREKSMQKDMATRIDGAAKSDPQKLFELVSQNYDSWSQVINRQFNEQEQFSPIPREDDGRDSKQKPIFNYSILDALEQASCDFSDRINKLEESENVPDIQNLAHSQSTNGSSGSAVKGGPNTEKDPRPETLLKESEIEFLRNRISELVIKNRLSIEPYGQLHKTHPEKREGFSLYDTQDEEGLHEGNTGDIYYDSDNGADDDNANQNDYDLEELNDGEEFSYDYSPTHHIEVELNTAPECEKHGSEICDCPIDERYTHYDDDEEGPSCEFTFEYDRNGELVPTYSNVEEKLRLMSLNSGGRLNKSANRGARNMKLPSIRELNIDHSNRGDGATNGEIDPTQHQHSDKKSKKKNKKKKNKKNGGSKSCQNAGEHQHQHEQPDHQHQPHARPQASGGNVPQSCLFCEYRLFYGTEPRQMIKWYDQRIKKDEERRQQFKRKLENAKSKALKRQRELRQRQMEENGLSNPHSEYDHHHDHSQQQAHEHEHSHDQCEHADHQHRHEHSHSHGHEHHEHQHEHLHEHQHSQELHKQEHHAS